MATESDLKREIADERRELTNAVASLREEIGQATERGKQVGVMAGAVAATMIALRTALKIRRRHRES
jgi:uncharacterized protein involved in exopolysaccharide biosynthesis